MLRFANSLIRYCVRQSKPKAPSEQQIQRERQQLYEDAVYNYSLAFRPHEDRVYQQRIYGRNCYVVGITPDSQDSNTYIKSVLTNLKPSHVILGGFNNTRLISSLFARTVEDKRKVRAYDTYIEPQKLFCKSLITPMITKLLLENPHYRVEKDTDAVQYVDHASRHLHSLNYATIMNSLHYKEFTKLSFGMPSDIILFQDIMINQSLNDLRAAFDKVIIATRECRDQYGQLIRSTQFHPDMIYEEMSYNALYEPITFKKQLTYTTALINRYASVSERALLFVDNRFVQQVAQNVHKISIDPKDVFRQGCTGNLDSFINDSSSQSGAKLNAYLNATNKDEAINQLLEKFTILKYLKDYGLQMQLLNGQNIFQKTVFRSLFQHLTHEQIIQRYEKARKKYKTIVSSLLTERVMNMRYFKPDYKQHYTLNQMILTQQQRNIDYPINFSIRNRQVIKYQKVSIKQIKKLISQIIKKQLPESDQKMMEKHFQGCITKESILLYEKLFVEAKIRLKKTDLKLPIYHRSMDLSSVFKDQLKAHMLRGDSRFINQKILQKQLNKLKSKAMFRQIHSEEELNQILNTHKLLGTIDQEGKAQPAFPQFENEQQIQQFIKTLGEDQLFGQIYKLSKEGRQSYEEQIQQKIDQKKVNQTKMEQKNEKKNPTSRQFKSGKKRR